MRRITTTTQQRPDHLVLTIESIRRHGGFRRWLGIPTINFKCVAFANSTATLCCKSLCSSRVTWFEMRCICVEHSVAVFSKQRICKQHSDAVLQVFCSGRVSWYQMCCTCVEQSCAVFRVSLQQQIDLMSDATHLETAQRRCAASHSAAAERLGLKTANLQTTQQRCVASHFAAAECLDLLR